MLNLSITYNLSQIGQKESLKCGGDGKQMQTATGTITVEQLEDLADIGFKVAADGSLSNNGYSGYAHHIYSDEPGEDIQKLIQTGAGLTKWKPLYYDAPQCFGTLLDDYARIVRSQNAQVKQVREAAARVQAEKREKAIAEGNEAFDAFFADQSLRVASVYDYQHKINGKTINDKHPRWKEFQAEARARAQADIDAKAAAETEREQAKQDQIAAWVRQFGSDDQKERLAAGLFPRDEAVSAIKAAAFAAGAKLALYSRITQADIEHDSECCSNWGGDWSLVCDTNDAASATAEEWAQLKEVVALFPDAAEVSIKRHTCKCSECGAEEERGGIYVKLQLGAFTFNREYAI